jgi:hypothetical protein
MGTGQFGKTIPGGEYGVYGYFGNLSSALTFIREVFNTSSFLVCMHPAQSPAFPPTMKPKYFVSLTLSSLFLTSACSLAFRSQERTLLTSMDAVRV